MKISDLKSALDYLDSVPFKLCEDFQMRYYALVWLGETFSCSKNFLLSMFKGISIVLLAILQLLEPQGFTVSYLNGKLSSRECSSTFKV